MFWAKVKCLCAHSITAAKFSHIQSKSVMSCKSGRVKLEKLFTWNIINKLTGGTCGWARRRRFKISVAAATLLRRHRIYPFTIGSQPFDAHCCH